MNINMKIVAYNNYFLRKMNKKMNFQLKYIKKTS